MIHHEFRLFQCNLDTAPLQANLWSTEPTDALINLRELMPHRAAKHFGAACLPKSFHCFVFPGTFSTTHRIWAQDVFKLWTRNQHRIHKIQIVDLPLSRPDSETNLRNWQTCPALVSASPRNAPRTDVVCEVKVGIAWNSSHDDSGKSVFDIAYWVVHGRVHLFSA